MHLEDPRAARRRSRLPIRSTFAALALFTALACGGGSGGGGGPTPPPPGNDGTGTVGPAGGTVALGTEAGVDVPSGALDGEISITISRVSMPGELASEGAIGQAYRFQPEGQVFQAPVEVFVFVPDAALAGRDPASLTLLTTGGAAGMLNPAAVEVLSNVRSQAASGGVTLRGNTTHFSTIAAAPGVTVDAGDDQTVNQGATVDLSGSASAPAGGSVQVQWSFVSRPSGSQATLDQPGSLTPSFQSDEPGEYVLRLQGTGPSGATASDQVTITVEPQTAAAPVADAGEDQTVDVGTRVELDGTGSTGNPAPNFVWEVVQFPGSAPPSLNNAATARPSFIPQNNGTYVLRLTAVNGHGQDTDEVTITVNAPPQASIDGPSGAVVGTNVTLASNATDPDGDDLTMSWRFLSRPPGSGATIPSTGGSVSFVGDVPGEYEVELTVDDGRLERTATIVVVFVPNVAGTYDLTFVLESATEPCGLPDDMGNAIGPKPTTISQDGRFITIHLTELTEGNPDFQIMNDVSGPIDPDGNLDFQSNVDIVVQGDAFTASGGFHGHIDPATEAVVNYSFSVFTCTVSGFFRGPKI